MIGRATIGGALAGLAIAAMMMPAMVGELTTLHTRRQASAALSRSLAATPADDAAGRLAAGSARRAIGTVAAQARRAAHANGVLVETLRPAAPAGPHLATLRIGLSGPEKAVLVVADAIERDRPGTRWRRWRMAALPGGMIRIDGEVAVAWR